MLTLERIVELDRTMTEQKHALQGTVNAWFFEVHEAVVDFVQRGRLISGYPGGFGPSWPEDYEITDVDLIRLPVDVVGFRIRLTRDRGASGWLLDKNLVFPAVWVLDPELGLQELRKRCDAKDQRKARELQQEVERVRRDAAKLGYILIKSEIP